MEKLTFLLLNLLMVVWANPKPNDHADKRIFGGQIAMPNMFPYQAGIFTPHRYLCSGSIVASKWILTSARCVQPFKPYAHFLNILVGEYEQCTLKACMREFMNKMLKVSAVITHELYKTLGTDKNLYQAENDIALLYMRYELQLTGSVNLIKLGYDIQPRFEMEYLVASWGAPNESFRSSKLLRYIPMKVVALSECRQLNSMDVSLNYTLSKICAVPRYSDGWKGLCEGDTGSALIMKLPNGRYVQIGVASSTNFCTKGIPDAFESVFFHRYWIQKYISIYKS